MTLGNLLHENCRLGKDKSALVLSRAKDNSLQEIESALKRIFPDETEEVSGDKDTVFMTTDDKNGEDDPKVANQESVSKGDRKVSSLCLFFSSLSLFEFDA